MTGWGRDARVQEEKEVARMKKEEKAAGKKAKEEEVKAVKNQKQVRWPFLLLTSRFSLSRS
jgi:hypothetical protein